MGLLPCCHFGLLTWALTLMLLFLLSEVQGDCGHPEPIPYATLASELNDSYPIGTVLRYRCIPGYENIPRTTPSIQCLNNSTWSEPPTFCRGRQCRVPHIENGRVITTDDVRLGAEITFVCEHGYRLIGQNTARCVVSGSTVDWNRESPYCQIIPCFPPPKITNGSHSGTDGDEYVYGSAVTYKCDTGFSLIGNASISCTTTENGVDGEWSGPAPECKVVQCRRPTIQNGRVAGVFQATYTYDNNIKMECDAGHTLLGSEYINCGADSSWHPAVPTCAKGIFTTVHPGILTTPTTVHPGDKTNETSVVQCKRPEIQNGRVTGALQPSYPYDKVVTIECDPGYGLEGNNSIKCGANSLWHPAIPTCVKGSSTTTLAIGKLTHFLALLVLIV